MLPIPRAPKAVLKELADFSNRNGVCWPAVSTLAERTGYTERSVSRALNWLEDNGLLRRERRRRRNGYYGGWKFALCLHAWDTLGQPATEVAVVADPPDIVADPHCVLDSEEATEPPAAAENQSLPIEEDRPPEVGHTSLVMRAWRQLAKDQIRPQQPSSSQVRRLERMTREALDRRDERDVVEVMLARCAEGADNVYALLSWRLRTLTSRPGRAASRRLGSAPRSHEAFDRLAGRQGLMTWDEYEATARGDAAA